MLSHPGFAATRFHEFHRGARRRRESTGVRRRADRVERSTSRPRLPSSIRPPGGPDDDVEAFLKPDAVHSFFAQDLPESSRWLIVESQRPITGAAGTTPSGLAAWKSLPSWAMVGTKDRV
jgi:hypothetical protein